MARDSNGYANGDGSAPGGLDSRRPTVILITVLVLIGLGFYWMHDREAKHQRLRDECDAGRAAACAILSNPNWR